MKMIIAPFSHEWVTLRLIEASDLEITLDWRNRDDARIWFKTSTPLTLDQHQTWFHRYLNKNDDFLFVVEVNGRPVGQASVYGIEWNNGCAEIGRFLVAPESAGKGYIGKACEALICLCSNTLSLRYLFLEVIETNNRAIQLYQRNGFKEEYRDGGLIRMSRKLESASKVNDVSK